MKTLFFINMNRKSKTKDSLHCLKQSVCLITSRKKECLNETFKWSLRINQDRIVKPQAITYSEEENDYLGEFQGAVGWNIPKDIGTDYAKNWSTLNDSIVREQLVSLIIYSTFQLSSLLRLKMLKTTDFQLTSKLKKMSSSDLLNTSKISHIQKKTPETSFRKKWLQKLRSILCLVVWKTTPIRANNTVFVLNGKNEWKSWL